jgi:hypothetical protein
MSNLPAFERKLILPFNGNSEVGKLCDESTRVPADTGADEADVTAQRP